MLIKKILVLLSLLLTLTVSIWLLFFSAAKYSVTHEWFEQSKYPTSHIKETFKQQVITLTPDDATEKSTVFFILGNEGNMTENGLVSIYKAYGSPKDIIFMVAEHRGYGESVTDGNQDIPDYVSANYALLDFNKVIKAKRKHYIGNWIVAGYSYGGALSIAYAHEFPETFDVALASSAPIIWPFFIPQYSLQAKANIPKALRERLMNHGLNIQLTKADSESHVRKELLTTIYVGLSQMKVPQSLLFAISGLSYLPTDYFFKALDIILPKAAYSWVIGRTSMNAPQDPTTRGWYTWMYQQCNELGTFFIGEPFTDTQAEHIDKCEQVFKTKPKYANKVTWNLSEKLEKITKPIVVVSGGKDPWVQLGVKPNHSFSNIEYIYEKDWFHCPDLSEPDAAQQVVNSLKSQLANR